MTDLKPEDLARLREIAEKATPGEWHAGHFADDDHPCNCDGVVSEVYMGSVATVSASNGLPVSEGGNDSPPPEEAKANLRHIAAFSPSVCLSLLADRARMEGIIRSYQAEVHEVEQTVGKALGYPWFKDDQANFPGATEADGVCVGEHVAGTITRELADRCARMEKALREAEEVLALAEQPRMVDPDYGDEVESLGRRIGFGALMSSAQASWRKHSAIPGGEHVAGPCFATVVATLKTIRQALGASQ